eukprot:15459110-Alexandrium_andersonii.AAC.2
MRRSKVRVRIKTRRAFQGSTVRLNPVLLTSFSRQPRRSAPLGSRRKTTRPARRAGSQSMPRMARECASCNTTKPTSNVRGPRLGV